MTITQAECDAWLIIQGETQERLDRIHAEANALRARRETEGRGPSTVWEPASSDDEDFGDTLPMTPPASPLRAPRGPTSKQNESVIMENQQPKLGDVPLQNIRPTPSTSPHSQTPKLQSRRQRGALVPVSGRNTRSNVSKTAAFYELTHDNKTSQRVSSMIAPMNPPKVSGLKRPNKSSPQHKRRSVYRVQKR